MSDGMFTVPIVSDDGLTITGWGRGYAEVKDANFHKLVGSPLRHLRVVDGAVVQISQTEKDAMAAADEAEIAASIAAEQAQAESAASARAQAAIDAANAPFRISKLMVRQAFYSMGKAAEFRAFLASDIMFAEMWADAQYLMTDNPLVVSSLSSFAPLLPENVTIADFLRSCEDR
jgi:hypothetical protein